MAEDQFIFLNDQVQRLNHTLAKYKTQSNSELNVDYTLPEVPWFTNKEHLAPLLEEYDETIKKITAELDTQREYVRHYKSQFERLIAENSRLQRDLKAHVTGELERVTGLEPGSDLGAALNKLSQSTSGDDQIQENLHLQLQEAVREKEATFELWQTALKEVDRMEEEMKAIRANPHYQVMEQQTDQLQRQYYSTVQSLTHEIDQLKGTNRQLKEEKRSHAIKIKELDELRLDATNQLEGYRRGERDLDGKMKEQHTKILMLEKECSDLKHQLSHAQHSVTSDHREKNDYEQRISDLSKKCSQYEEQAYQAVLKVKESVAMVETAMLEREQAELRERQRLEECERLQSAINRLLDEAGVRTREEVEAVKVQANNNLNRIIEELNIAETEKSHSIAELERVSREKERLEGELERHLAEARVGQKQEALAAEEATRRALRAERERDQTKMQLDTAKVAMEREQTNWKNERSQLRGEVDQLRERVNALNQSCERAQAETQRYASLVEEAEQKAIQAKKEAERSDRKNIHQTALLEQQSRLKEQEYQIRVQTGADTQRQALADMRQMLAMQQKVTSRWKEECHTIAEKMEEKVNQQRSDLDRQKKRNEELSLLLAESRTKLTENESSINDYCKLVKRLEERLKLTERRTALATQQSSKFLHREQKWMDFKKEQQSAIQEALSKSQIPEKEDASRGQKAE